MQEFYRFSVCRNHNLLAMKKTNRLTTYILLSMLAGVLVGYLVHVNADAVFIKEFSANVWCK
jgi:thiamine transporter ThiT